MCAKNGLLKGCSSVLHEKLKTSTRIFARLFLILPSHIEKKETTKVHVLVHIIGPICLEILFFIHMEMLLTFHAFFSDCSKGNPLTILSKVKRFYHYCKFSTFLSRQDVLSAHSIIPLLLNPAACAAS